jgi:hypothetical protein
MARNEHAYLGDGRPLSSGELAREVPANSPCKEELGPLLGGPINCCEEPDLRLTQRIPNRALVAGHPRLTFEGSANHFDTMRNYYNGEPRASHPRALRAEARGRMARGYEDLNDGDAQRDDMLSVAIHRMRPQLSRLTSFRELALESFENRAAAAHPDEPASHKVNE